MKECEVGCNNADKKRGPVIHSNDSYAEQCSLHLEDDKGTYRKIIDRTKEDIIKEILVKLGGILIPFKKRGEGCKAACEFILRDARDVAKEGMLCKFYPIWKLHRMANAAGIRIRPIAAAINCVTGPASQGGLEAQQCLERLAGSDQSKLQRRERTKTRTGRCCCPLSLYTARTRNASLAVVYG